MINDFNEADFDGDGKFDAIDISILEEEEGARKLKFDNRGAESC